jgi:hypothetical protein
VKALVSVLWLLFVLAVTALVAWLLGLDEPLRDALRSVGRSIGASGRCVSSGSS